MDSLTAILTYEEVVQMRTTMQRTITISEIHFATTEVKNGDVSVTKHKPFNVVGKVTMKNAHKHLIGIENPLITKIEYTENSYIMDLEDFIQHATLTDFVKVELDDKEEN